MVKINIHPKTEDNKYRVQDVKDNGFVVGSIDIEQEELGELMKELTVNEPYLLDTLRKCYQLFEVQSMTFKENE
jgi:hypothetical protein